MRIKNTYHRVLPFCHFTITLPVGRIKTFILNKKGFKAAPKTLGNHLLNRRLSLGLRQEDVASRLGTQREVYERWEQDKRLPVVSEWPGLIEFLGSYPDLDLGGNPILKARRLLGLTQKELARKLHIDDDRLRQLEQGISVDDSQIEKRISTLLAA